MKSIELLAGSIGSGKAYIMSKHVQQLKEVGNNVYLISFADPIKKIVEEMYHIDKNGNVLSDKEVDFSNDNIKFFNFLPPNYIKHTNVNTKIYFNDIKEKYFAYKEGLITSKDFARYALQIIGTEVGQNLRKTIWVDIAIDKIKNIIDDVDYVIIDDWRFLFELTHIQSELCQPYDIELKPFYITASDEVRAKRRGITVENLNEMSKHVSERESKEVILPFMNIYYPNKIIFNEGD